MIESRAIDSLHPFLEGVDMENDKPYNGNHG